MGLDLLSTLRLSVCHERAPAMTLAGVINVKS